DDVLQRGDERAVVLLLLVPPTIFRREDRADQHLVDRRVELDPGKALGELAVEFIRTKIGLVERRSVAKEIDPNFLDAVEILAPAVVMAADRHLVDARLAMIDGRDAVLDPGREHEVGDESLSSGICLTSSALVRPVARRTDSGTGRKRKPSPIGSRGR